jgi:hypothetical protein
MPATMTFLMTAGMTSLWAAIQGDAVFMRRVNGWLTMFWLVMIAISLAMGWVKSVTYVSGRARRASAWIGRNDQRLNEWCGPRVLRSADRNVFGRSLGSEMQVACPGTAATPISALPSR